MVRVVPGLEGKWVSGSLAEGWQLRDTKWQNDYVGISLKQVDAKWKLTSLLSGQFEINSLCRGWIGRNSAGCRGACSTR